MNLSTTYHSYKPSMVRITISNRLGDLHMGSAFHIGDGWLVTAGHVITDGTIVEVVSEHTGNNLEIYKTILHPDKDTDLALLHTNLDLSHYIQSTVIHGAHSGFVQTDHVEIGCILNDTLGDELVMSRVLLMGYPPVPLANSPLLFAAAGEINAVLDKYNSKNPHFLISCMGRGGFSGGPVISENGFLIGVLVESLVKNGCSEELGYSSAITTEPLLWLLSENSIFPGNNSGVVRDFSEIS